MTWDYDHGVPGHWQEIVWDNRARQSVPIHPTLDILNRADDHIQHPDVVWGIDINLASTLQFLRPCFSRMPDMDCSAALLGIRVRSKEKGKLDASVMTGLDWISSE